MKSSDRRLKILLMLQSRRKEITINFLADYFKVSRRTIFRDLNALQAIEVPVSYEPGAGYSVPRGYSVPPLMFTPKEIATILVGLSFVKSQQDKKLNEDARAAQLKIHSALPGELKSVFDSLESTIIVDPYLFYSPNKTEGVDWYTIALAITNHSVISFIYRDGQKRTINPYLLVYFSDHWNVIGKNRDHRQIRNYRLEHIKDLEVSAVTFSTNEVPKSASTLIFRSEEALTQIELLIENDIWAEFVRTFPSKIDNYEQTSAGVKVQFKFDNLDFMNNWLLRFGDRVTLLSPEKLRKQRRAMAKKMARLAGGP